MACGFCHSDKASALNSLLFIQLPNGHPIAAFELGHDFTGLELAAAAGLGRCEPEAGAGAGLTSFTAQANSVCFRMRHAQGATAGICNSFDEHPCCVDPSYLVCSLRVVPDPCTKRFIVFDKHFCATIIASWQVYATQSDRCASS